jgi:ubiquinone/menaquinone biosynthesis C-methylase UbiE
MDSDSTIHTAIINDQFTRQAHGFSASPELHNDAVLSLLVDPGKPEPHDRMLDVACGPGTVVVAFSPHVAHADGLDATDAMLTQAKALSTAKALTNVRWQLGNVYALPYATDAFDIVTCRFAFHHFEDPQTAFAEMVRIAAPGTRIILCDAIASDETRKLARSAKWNAFGTLPPWNSAHWDFSAAYSPKRIWERQR